MKTAICIASGPSLTQEDVDLCKGKAKVYVVNDTYRLAPWADVLYACDYKWWYHYDGAKDFAGEKWTIDEEAARHFNLNKIGSTHDKSFSLEDNKIALGSNSGFQAMNLAAIQGATRIILLGYDMKMGPNNKRHWFGEHPDFLLMNSNYSRWVEKFHCAENLIKRCGIEVINCTLDSAIECFEKKPIESISW